MIATDYFIEPADWRLDYADIAAIRTEVFIHEQAVPEDEEFDDDDRTAQHFLAREIDGSVLGTARLTTDGRIGRMAVLAAGRGRGVGAALLRACIDAGRLRGDHELRLAAQCHALDFYARQGFVPFGEVFDDVGIDHQWMRLKLADESLVQPVESPRRQPADSALMTSGRTSTLEELSTALEQFLACCDRRLDLFTHDFDPRLLSRTVHLDRLREILAFAYQPMVRILVCDNTAAVKAAHRWLPLAQERPSAMQIRNPGRDHRDEPSAFYIADRRHVLVRPQASRWECELHVDAPRYAEQLREFFEDAWEHATPDPDARRLGL